MFDKKILLVRNDTTFMVNAIKKSLVDNHFIVAETSYSISDISAKKADASLAILYTDGDYVEHQDAIIYFKELCLDENMIVIIIGDNETFKFIHRFIPKEDIACEMTRPLDMDELLSKIYIVTDEEYIQMKRKCILVVDDDFTYLQMLREWLKENKADLILLDYDMPVIDGPKVMEMLKKESFSSGIPVMFLTGKNDKKSVTEVLALKPADYLLKSIDKEKLLDTLRNFFESRE